VDYWHHWTDVVAGLGLGFLVAWLCYRQQGVKLRELDVVAIGVRDSDPAEGEALLRPTNGGHRSSILPL
jgi:PAP2 superfamily